MQPSLTSTARVVFPSTGDRVWIVCKLWTNPAWAPWFCSHPWNRVCCLHLEIGYFIFLKTIFFLQIFKFFLKIGAVIDYIFSPNFKFFQTIGAVIYNWFSQVCVCIFFQDVHQFAIVLIIICSVPNYFLLLGGSPETTKLNSESKALLVLSFLPGDLRNLRIVCKFFRVLGYTSFSVCLLLI